MTTATPIATASDLVADDYLVLGLATCFVKEEGEVHEVQVVEPIPSSALETLIKGIPTSYSQVIATTIGTVYSQGDAPQLPANFPDSAQFCEDFTFRAIAAARTYKSHPTAQAHVPAGTTRTDFNYSTERKRVLNLQRVIRTEDNVKQHEYTHKVL